MPRGNWTLYFRDKKCITTNVFIYRDPAPRNIHFVTSRGKYSYGDKKVTIIILLLAGEYVILLIGLNWNRQSFIRVLIVPN